MSTIPPNWLGSVAQTQGAAARTAAHKNREAGAAAEREAGVFAGQLADAIEETDRDSQVYSDAEGTGSQGRPTEPDESAAPRDEDAGDQGTQLDVHA